MKSIKILTCLLILNITILCITQRNLTPVAATTTISDTEIYFRANDGVIEYFGAGKGESWDNPYTFENYEFINTQIVFDYTHLRVLFNNSVFSNSKVVIFRSTHVHFINCTFEGLSTERYIKTYGEPQYDYFVSDVVIDDCNFEGNGEIDGLQLSDDIDTIVKNSNFTNFYEAILAIENRNMLIETCIINQSEYGVHYRGVNNSIIRNNIFDDGSYAIALETRHLIHFDTETGFTVIDKPTRDCQIYYNVFNRFNAIGIDSAVFNNTWCLPSIERGNWYFNYLIVHPTAENNTIYFDEPYQITENVYDDFPLVTHLGYFNFSSGTESNNGTTNNGTDSTETNPFTELLWILGIGAIVIVGGIGLWFLIPFIYRKIKNR